MSEKTETVSALSTVEIRDNGVLIDNAPVDDNGQWTFNAIGLAPGSHRLTAHLGNEVSDQWTLTVEQALALIEPYVDHSSVRPPVAGRQTLAYYSVNSDIDIVVPDYGMRAGDMVRVYWAGRNTTYSSEIQTVTSLGPLRFEISKYEVIDCIGYSSTRVHYTVIRGAAAPIPSHILSLDVTGYAGEAVYPAPTLNDARNNIRVQKSGNVSTETTAEVRGLGASEWQSSTQTFGDANYLNFPVSPAWLSANKGKAVRFNYSLRLKPSDGNSYRFSQLLRINPL